MLRKTLNPEQVEPDFASAEEVSNLESLHITESSSEAAYLSRHRRVKPLDMCKPGSGKLLVAGFLAFFTCSFIPVIAYPAYKASTADPNKVSRGSEAGFSKTGMWGQIDK